MAQKWCPLLVMVYECDSVRGSVRGSAVGGGALCARGQHHRGGPAPLVVDSTMRLFLPRCDDDVCPSAKSAVTKSVLIATNPPLWRASSGGRLLPLAAPNMMNKLQEARRARALRQDGCAKG